MSNNHAALNLFILNEIFDICGHGQCNRRCGIAVRTVTVIAEVETKTSASTSGCHLTSNGPPVVLTAEEAMQEKDG